MNLRYWPVMLVKYGDYSLLDPGGIEYSNPGEFNQFLPRVRTTGEIDFGASPNPLCSYASE